MQGGNGLAKETRSRRGACSAGRAELGSVGNTVSKEDAGLRGCWGEGGTRQFLGLKVSKEYGFLPIAKAGRGNNLSKRGA